MFASNLPSTRRTRNGAGRVKDILLLGLVVALFAVLGPAGANDSETRRLKIAFEVSSNEAFETFVGNVEGLQANFVDLAEITVVASFDGVGLFLAEGNTFEARLARLADLGVDFVVCQQSIARLEIKSADLLGFARLARSGSEQIEQMEKQGWARVGDGESYVSNL